MITSLVIFLGNGKPGGCEFSGFFISGYGASGLMLKGYHTEGQHLMGSMPMRTSQVICLPAPMPVRPSQFTYSHV